MALDATAADKVLKINYMGPLRQQQNNAHVLVKHVHRNKKAYSGKQAYLPLHVRAERRGSVPALRAEPCPRPGTSSTSRRPTRRRTSTVGSS